jgi:transcriptional regulator GlxA family with amidase domain
MMAEIGILLYPGAQQAAVLGLVDLFAVANMQAEKIAGASAGVLRVSQWQPDETTGVMHVVSDTHPDMEHHIAVMILPPSLTEPSPAGRWRAVAEKLLELHHKGVTLCSVCAGSFLLGETGLLAKRTATTHWSLEDMMASRFPETTVDTARLMVDDGDIITAGGLMAWTDLGLRLVDRLLGPTVMLATANFLLVDPSGREQRFYSPFSPRMLHGDEAILKAQHWLAAQGGRDCSLTHMATQAGLEARTFQRRFVKATGLKPVVYCQMLRVGKARAILEFTQRTVEQVAYEVGYDDAGAFRKVFYKVVGLSPGDYRRRFSAGVEPRL